MFLTVSAYIVFLYIYTDSPHEHPVFPGCLRRNQFFFFRNPAKDGFEGHTAAVTVVWGGLFHTFPCDRAESSEGVHLIFWDRSFAN